MILEMNLFRAAILTLGFRKWKKWFPCGILVPVSACWGLSIIHAENMLLHGVQFPSVPSKWLSMSSVDHRVRHCKLPMLSFYLPT